MERFVAAVQAGGVRPGPSSTGRSCRRRSHGLERTLGGLADDLVVWWTSARTGQGIEALRRSVQVGETTVRWYWGGWFTNQLHGTDASHQPCARQTPRAGTPRRTGSWCSCRVWTFARHPGMRELQLWMGRGWPTHTVMSKPSPSSVDGAVHTERKTAVRSRRPSRRAPSHVGHRLAQAPAEGHHDRQALQGPARAVIEVRLCAEQCAEQLEVVGMGATPRQPAG